MAQKDLEGPVCLMTVPFSQLANADVFAKAHELRCVLYGANTWYVFCEMAEWPHEYPRYLEGSGITLEDTDHDVTDMVGKPEQWQIGLY